jgi:hypothetical protein
MTFEDHRGRAGHRRDARAGVRHVEKSKLNSHEAPDYYRDHTQANAGQLQS